MTEVPAEAFKTLRTLARGRACPSGAAELLLRIASRRAVTSHDIYYALMINREDASRNVYARLRAAGLDLNCDTIPFGGSPADYPAQPAEVITVRESLRDAAAALVAEMDAAAERFAVLDTAYGKELGWS